MPIPSSAPPTSTATIFARLWDGKARLTPALARHVLKLGFSDSDTARMSELARRNTKNALSQAEQDELDSYIAVGDLLAVLQSKARRLVRQVPAGYSGLG